MTQWRRKALVLIMISSVLIACLSGCMKPKAYSIALPEEAEKIRLDIKTAKNLEPMISPADADTEDFEYCSTDESVATYRDGLIITRNPGTCQVYVRCGKLFSNPVTIQVSNYILDAENLNKRIADEAKYNWLSSTCKPNMRDYENLPDYAQKLVTNEPMLRKEVEAFDERLKAGRESKAASGNSADKVYVTSGGSKYHKKGCKTLRGGGSAVSLSKAKADGKQPCKVCKP